MHIALSILAIVAAVVAVTALAERIRFSAPLLLMLVGIVASFLPFIHEPELTTDVVLVGFLPPLLYAAAIRSSVQDFRANWRPIGYLSVGLVLVTALGIGLITWLILPVPFALAFAFGAVVAPPDAVAATTIARRIGMPRQIVTETTPRHATSTGPKEGLDTEVSLRTSGRSWNSSADYCQQTVKSV